MKKFIYTICIILGLMMSTGMVAEAKGSIIELCNQETYYYDLNGDGKKEEIYCSMTRNGYWVYINDKLVKYKTGLDEGADFYIADFNTKDKYMEIGVAEGIWEHGYDRTTFYRYEKGKLKKYFKINKGKGFWRYDFSESQPGNGKVVLNMDTPVKADNLGQYYAKMVYKVSGGKLKRRNYNGKSKI